LTRERRKIFRRGAEKIVAAWKIIDVLAAPMILASAATAATEWLSERRNLRDILGVAAHEQPAIAVVVSCAASSIRAATAGDPLQV
jgi:hypothetical protein